MLDEAPRALSSCTEVGVRLPAHDPQRLTRAHRRAARTTWRLFPMAAIGGLFLTRRQRRAYYAMAAFLREADVLSEAEGARARAQWQSLKARALAEVPDVDDDMLLAFAHARIDFKIPRDWVEAQLHGLSTGHLRPRHQTLDDLASYCMKVLAPIGLITGRILGVTDPQTQLYAARFAMALQFSDVLCDLAEDLQAGQDLLPIDLLKRHGVCLQQIQVDGLHPGWQAALQELMDVNHQLYARAEPGVARLPLGAALAAAVIGALYQAQLSQMQASGFDVFVQPPGFRARHLLNAGRSALRVVASRLRPRRAGLRVWPSVAGAEPS